MKPVVLIIMDGYGLGEDVEGNAVAAAKKPNLDRLGSHYPSTSLGSAGRDVGLPPGQMGNSEVGHLNLGAGRIVYQDYTRISLAIEENRLKDNSVLREAMERRETLHLLGLLSDGGVHSHNTHLYALLEMARNLGHEVVFVHAILDGRDVPPKSALVYFRELEERFGSNACVTTVSGRYYAMDRDRRFERIEKAYDALTKGKGFSASSAEEAVQMGYDRGETDEFIQPTVVETQGLIRKGHSVIFFNFRPDRARQITAAFVEEDFKGFPRVIEPVHFVCMTEYDESLKVPVAFPPQYLKETLGEVVSKAGLRQQRIAETEKYAHVTYFFNGGNEAPNPGEDRVLIPSPKVATYDLQPEMSAYSLTDVALDRIASKRYDLIVMNYANPDMVGHTGFFPAAVKAVETVDHCVGSVVEAVLDAGGVALITADHGNAEKMIDRVTGQPHTAHTINRVPFIVVGWRKGVALRGGGILADVAPTILHILSIERPEAMTGRSLILEGS